MALKPTLEGPVRLSEAAIAELDKLGVEFKAELARIKAKHDHLRHAREAYSSGKLRTVKALHKIFEEAQDLFYKERSLAIKQYGSRVRGIARAELGLDPSADIIVDQRYRDIGIVVVTPNTAIWKISLLGADTDD